MPRRRTARNLAAQHGLGRHLDPAMGRQAAACNRPACRQLLKALGPMGGAQGMMADSLRAELEDEPFVAEFPRLE
jgi:hypothetical protein